MSPKLKNYQICFSHRYTKLDPLKLKRIDLHDGKPFSSAAMIIDEESESPKTVAVVIFSGGGNIIYLNKREYIIHLDEIQVTAEKFIGETLKARRIKVFMCEAVEVEEY